MLDKLPSNGSIYHTDKFGVKRKIGDILSMGRQTQDLGSPEKIQPTEKGKWFWQAESIQEVSEVFAKYFFRIECKEKYSQLRADFANCSINTNKEQKNSPIKKKPQFSQRSYIKLAQILKWELFRQRVKREKPIYKLWYQQKTGKMPRYFLLDTYQEHRERQLDQLPVGSVNNLVLNRGEIYQFFYGFG